MGFGDSYTSKHRHDWHIPDLPKGELAAMSRDYIAHAHGKASIAYYSLDRRKRTSAFPKSIQRTVWHNDAFGDTFRESSEPGAAHNANLRATEVRRKELRKFHDIFRRGGRRHGHGGGCCRSIALDRYFFNQKTSHDNIEYSSNSTSPASKCHA